LIVGATCFCCVLCNIFMFILLWWLMLLALLNLYVKECITLPNSRWCVKWRVLKNSSQTAPRMTSSYTWDKQFSSLKYLASTSRYDVHL
jgi:hypothetical protein